MPRVIITVPDKTPQPYRFQLDRQVVTIGRGSVNDIAIDCASVSVKHAEMARIEGGYELRDLASTNGTKLDGERMDVVPLRSGSAVTLGDVAFDFQLSDEEREELAREKVLDDLPSRRKSDDDTEAEELPRIRRAAPKKPVVVDTSGGGGGFMMFLLFLFLALVAFFAGLSIRYYKDTGGGLFDAIQNKSKTLKATKPEAKPIPAAPAPAPAPPPVAVPTPTPEPAPVPVPVPTPEPAPAVPVPVPTPEPAPVPVPVPTPEPAPVPVPEPPPIPEPAPAQ